MIEQNNRIDQKLAYSKIVLKREKREIDTEVNISLLLLDPITSFSTRFCLKIDPVANFASNGLDDKTENIYCTKLESPDTLMTIKFRNFEKFLMRLCRTTANL